MSLMRSIWLALVLLPALGAAEIPVVALNPSAELVKSDGQPFGPVTAAAVDGDEIAVLVGNDAVGSSTPSVVYVFTRQLDGHWLQTGQFNPTGAGVGTIFDIQIHGPLIVYQRSLKIPDDDATLSLVYVVEQQGSDWANPATVLAAGSRTARLAGDDIAVNTLQGVNLYHRLAPGVWQLSASLPQIGYSSVGDNTAGPVFDFDGNRVLIVTNVGVYAPGNPYGFANVVGRLYERDASNNWSLTNALPTDWSAVDYLPFRGEGRGLASLAGDNLSLIGRLFRRNPYGYWEQTRSVDSVTDSLSEVARAELKPGGVGLVNGQDLYRRGSDGLWHPRLRASAGIAAMDGHTAVTIQGSPSSGSTQNRVLVANLDMADSSTPLPATIFGLRIDPAAMPSGQSATLTARAYVHGNVTISKMEARVGAGAWQPMAAVDGAFDGAYESAQAQVLTGEVCIRVTDSAGRVSELVDDTTEPCPYVVGVAAASNNADNQPPRVSELTLDLPQPTLGQVNAIYAFADDGDSGSGLRAMQYRIDDGVWRLMKPFPGPTAADFYFLGQQYKAAQGVLPPVVETGMHTDCVRGIDNAGNVSEPQCTTNTVTY
jgi:hypothetical protein